MGDARQFKSEWPLNGRWEGSHIGRFEKLLENGFLSDIKFQVGSGSTQRIFPSHGLIIAAGSPILYDVVKKSNAELIFIDNTEPEIFHIFLKFLYTGTCDEVKVDKALPLLELASTYKVFDLHQICNRLLQEDFTDEHAIRIFQQAVFYNETQLAEKALRYVCRNAWNIIESEEFLKLHHKNLVTILENENLLVLNEAQLINGLIRWAKTNCEKECLPFSGENFVLILKGVLELISWDRIDHKNFLDKNAINEFEKLFSLYVSLNPKKLVGRSRRNYFDEDDTVFTTSRLPHKFAYCTENHSGDWEVFSLKTDRSVCLTSIGIPAYSQTCGDNFNIKVKISNTDLMSNMEVQEIVPHSTNIYHVKFPRPYKIRKDTWYDVSACITGTPGYGNTGGKSLTTIKCNTADGNETVVKFEFKPLNGTFEDISRGQIDEFSFKLAEN